MRGQAPARCVRDCAGLTAVRDGLAVRGLLVRHLVLPDNLAGSTDTLDFLVEHISPATAIHIMGQYRPCYQADAYPPLNRRPTAEEVASVLRYAGDKGLPLLS